MAFLLRLSFALARKLIASLICHPERESIGCHPEQSGSRSSRPAESKDLHLFLALFAAHRSPCPIHIAFLCEMSGKARGQSRPPITSQEGERCRAMPARSSRFLLWRRRREDLASRGFRFRLRLRSLLRFFSAFIFASHAASMTQTAAAEKPNSNPAPTWVPHPKRALCV
jgi:hypothetical protein